MIYGMIFAWILVGLSVAYHSAMLAYELRQFHPVVDMLLMPIIFAILGPIPVIAKLLKRLGL